jgi:hypothetical protein
MPLKSWNAGFIQDVEEQDSQSSPIVNYYNYI